MFTLSELWSGGERQGSYKLLKPWWEVFMDYLLVLMLMVSILAGTLQLSRDRVVCVLVHSSSTNYSSPMEPVPDSVFRSTPESPKIPVKGRRTNLDFQQYIYISQVCYHKALPWYSRFLPYVTPLHTLILLDSGCFWFHFPLTSARTEHFLSLLAKCCESPWTTRALSHTAKLDTRFSETEQAVQPKVQVTSSCKTRKSSLDSGTDSPLLAGTDSASTTTQPPPCPSVLSHCSTLSAMSLTEPVLTVQVIPDTSRQGAMLDRSKREQARALFKRVRRFRAHCESSDVKFPDFQNLTFLLETTDARSFRVKRRETFQRVISIQFKSILNAERYIKVLEQHMLPFQTMSISAGQCKTTYCSCYSSMAS